MASNYFAKGLKRSALTVALGLCFAGGVQAQSSVGSIFGQTESNQTVTITNTATGATRNVTVGSDGRFTFTQLAPGRYTVVSNGVTRNVDVNVGAGSSVSFSEGATNLDTVTVVGTSFNANAIDVSAVQSSTVFTAEQIARIPVGRTIQSVAILAPSVVSNSSYASNAPSFGGSASSENAYYINGYGVTNPLTSLGFSTLPFDAIDQMEVLTGGYGVQYGRSTGGVISVTTKRGTNDWKFGGAVFYTPNSTRADYENLYYPETGFYGPNSGELFKTDGQVRQVRENNTLDTLQYGLHASGPIIRDRLFFYASADWTKQDQEAVNTALPLDTYGANPGGVAPVKNGYLVRNQDSPRWAVKLDWQISDNHSLEFTGIQDETSREDFTSFYDTKTNAIDPAQSGGGSYKDGGKLYVGRYIGHFTDNLSLSVVYGEQTVNHSTNLFGYNPACPRVSGSIGANVKPGVVGAQGCQTQANAPPSGNFEETNGGRIDIDWVIGDHSLRLGYDDSTAHTVSGSEYAGGYVWVYGQQNDYDTPINAAAGVGAPGIQSQGNPAKDKISYFVRRQYFTNFADVETKQKAYYLEDRWQISDNFMLSLGVRNENFENFNGDGKVYVAQKNQWAPRVGFSWDVLGDQTLKVFGNAGRYHLALPNNVAARAAASSLYTQEYFNYTGIDPVTGAPTGLTNIAVDKSKGFTCPGNDFAISSNLECGNAKDPRTVAAKDLKPHFQDEYILGFQHQYNTNINWGMRAHWRSLKSAIDDTCTTVLGGGCFTFNPGIGNTFFEDDGNGGLKEVSYTAAQLDLPKLKRKYWAVDTFIERQGDKWFGRLEYSFSRNMGNTEGQLLSDLDTGGGGQSDVGQTQDWDLPSLMVNGYGLLPNHRAHQIKGYGYYELTSEFRVGASVVVTSGRPLSCTSYFPDPNADTYNGSYYHFCGLPPSSAKGAKYPNGYEYQEAQRGTSGTTGWSEQLNLSATYVPNWADKKLTFGVDVLNVLDQQDSQYQNMQFAASRTTPSRNYRGDLNLNAPRSVRFTLRYDY